MNMAPRWRPIEERFWQFASPEPNTGCWLWDGASTRGYGVILVDGRNTYATHISMQMVGRPRPTPWAIACHHCDMTYCVNPDHLYWGSDWSNAQDKVLRGRAVTGDHRGERNWAAKLTAEQVREIRQSTETRRDLAKRLGVSAGIVGAVLSGDTWRHVPGGRRPAGLASNRGERHRSAKLTAEQVRHIRASVAPSRALAKELSVSYNLIRMIRRGEVWKHVE